MGTDTATITWQTDEASTTVLTWGESIPPATVESDGAMVTDHEVTLDGLDPCTDYFFMVASVDSGGNEAVDDNGGAYYSFTTLQLMVMLNAPMDTDPGWTYAGHWAAGVPPGADGHPSSGHTGAHAVGAKLAGGGADGGGDRSPRQVLPIDHAVALKTPHGADVLAQDGDAVGAIGHRAAEPEKDQYRHRQKGTAASDDVEGTSNDSRYEQQEIFKGGHER